MIRKKIIVALSVIALIFSFAGCGGGGQPSNTDANAGLGSIVFTVPDDWSLTEFAPDSYSIYSGADSGYSLNVQMLTEGALESLDPAYSEMTVQEFFDKVCKASDENISKYDLEQESIEICGSDAVYLKRKAGDGEYLYLNAAWIYDDTVYRLTLADPSAVEEDGTPKEGAALLGSDEVAIFDKIISSVTPGDGASMQQKGIPENSIGAFTYTVPDGYEVTDTTDSFINMSKDNLLISISKTDESDYTELDVSSEEAAAALEEEYSVNAQDADPTTIAGNEGFISKRPDSDGNLRICTSGFMADGALYIITMSASSYDSDGNLIEDAPALTDDDVAVFEEFLASFTAQ